MGAQQSSAGEAASENAAVEQLSLCSLSSLSLHRSPGDCWICIDGLIYDVTDFIKSHPGGQQVILDVAGTDASAEFEKAAHPEHVRDDMKQYLIARLGEEEKTEPEPESVPSPVDEAAAASSASASASAEVAPASPDDTSSKKTVRVRILYGSQLGAGQSYADRLVDSLNLLSSKGLKSHTLNVSIGPMSEFDPEDLGNEEIVICVVSTYTDGNPPNNAQFFYDWVSEAAKDWRVEDSFLTHVNVAVLGLGNSLYEERYNIVAKKLNEAFDALGATRLCNLGLSDDSVSRNDTLTSEDDFVAWRDNELLPNLVLCLEQPKAFEQKVTIAKSKARSAQRAKARKERTEREKAERKRKEEEADAEVEAEDESDYEERFSDEDEDEDEAADGGEGDDDKVVDLEELGSVLSKANIQPNKDSKDASSSSTAAPAQPRAMLTDQLRTNLSKQGYKLVGTHSGVKLCRWTKAMLRGRGGCYKHTFYGIDSSQCMEMTPSLACANKCVFCWRHHTNPVGKDWRWQVDDPRMILDNALDNHKKMINTMKGVPGVQPQRLAAAQKPKHCALSLVGEPIMYPHINEYVRMLHCEGISSFLVTNAQFPDKIREMDPVTQLYVSIDAATQDSLKAVDRPLFSDFWQRFLDSLSALREKGQRTVYRLTLVKTFNMQELIEYAKLVSIGRPTFIEIKGVTFCGGGGAGNITLKDVPLHEEVCRFGQELCKHLEGNYELACEHQHSCCILIADRKLKVDGKWHTWIDYPKFNRLIHEYYDSGCTKTFTAAEYGVETPAWAVFGSEEAGFNPGEQRKQRKRLRPTLQELEKKFPGINEANEKAQQAGVAAAAAEAAATAAATTATSSTNATSTDVSPSSS